MEKGLFYQLVLCVATLLNSWPDSSGITGRDRVESVAGMKWNHWPRSCGICGRDRLEFAAMATPVYIKSVLKNNNCSVIIRSHDHYARTKSYNNKVVTFTTSKNLPNTKRLIVEVDLTVGISSINDLKLINLDKESV